MSEKSLHDLDMNDLIDLMVKSVNELLVLNKQPHDKPAIKTKMDEVELIQKEIGIRRAQ